MITLKQAREMSWDALQFTAKDLSGVIAAQEPMEHLGMRTPKIEQYRSELIIISAESSRRESSENIKAWLSNLDDELSGKLFDLVYKMPDTSIRRLIGPAILQRFGMQREDTYDVVAEWTMARAVTKTSA